MILGKRVFLYNRLSLFVQKNPEKSQKKSLQNVFFLFWCYIHLYITSSISNNNNVIIYVPCIQNPREREREKEREFYGKNKVSYHLKKN